MTAKLWRRWRVTAMGVMSLLAASALPMTAGMAAGASTAPPTRGTLMSATRVAQLGPREIRRAIRQMGLDGRPVRHGVDAYRLVYRTIAVDGRPTTASGLVVLPRADGRDLRTVVYEHGTNVPKSLAPSTSADSDARLVSLLFGSAGYAVVAPDYLGLGRGRGTQAYLHVRSEVSASLDMIRAARWFAAVRHRLLERRIVVSGFSQGGQAAMGLARALQRGTDPRLALGAVAAVAGPYDLQHAEVPAILAGRTEPTISNYNLTEFALSWRRLYHLYERPSQVFQPRTARIQRLFDGRHDDRTIFAALPHTLQQLFRPIFLRRLAHPGGGLLRGLRENDTTCAWRPRTPVRLYAAHGDRAVSITNSRRCQRQLRARGAHVRLVDLGGYDHQRSEAVAMPQLMRWLRRQGESPYVKQRTDRQ